MGYQVILFMSGWAKGCGVIADVTEATGNTNNPAVTVGGTHAGGKHHLATLTKAHEKQAIRRHPIGVTQVREEIP